MIGEMSFPLVIRDMTMAESRDVDGALSVMGEDEFRAFYERTARPLWAYLSRITGDRQQADDFLQEAYYRFYRAAARRNEDRLECQLPSAAADGDEKSTVTGSRSAGSSISKNSRGAKSPMPAMIELGKIWIFVL